MDCHLRVLREKVSIIIAKHSSEENYKYGRLLNAIDSANSANSADTRRYENQEAEIMAKYLQIKIGGHYFGSLLKLNIATNEDFNSINECWFYNFEKTNTHLFCMWLVLAASGIVHIIRGINIGDFMGAFVIVAVLSALIYAYCSMQPKSTALNIYRAINCESCKIAQRAYSKVNNEFMALVNNLNESSTENNINALIRKIGQRAILQKQRNEAYKAADDFIDNSMTDDFSRSLVTMTIMFIVSIALMKVY